MKIGAWDVETLGDGGFRLDGGAMFGVVPRVLWERSRPADAEHRVQLEARVLLLRDGVRTVLVDVGMGRKWSSRDASRFDLRGGGVVEALRGRGVEPADVTDVILTHLHFDHAGGLTQVTEAGIVPTYARARVHLQRRNLSWAEAPSARDRGSYRREDWAPYTEDSARSLRLLEGPGPILPGVEAVVCEGHTVGQQIVKVSGPEGTIVYPSDLLPTTSHLAPTWGMAYDLQPLVLLEEKSALLDAAIEHDHVVVFEHDPDVPAARLTRDDRGRAVVAEVVAL